MMNQFSQRRNNQNWERSIDFYVAPSIQKLLIVGMEFKLCGEVGCEICLRKPRVLNIDDDELTKAVLQICLLPRVDADAQEFLPIEECERLLENGDDLATELCKRFKANSKGSRESGQEERGE